MLNVAKYLILLSALIFTSVVYANASQQNEDINYCARHNPIDSDDNFKKCFFIGAGYLPYSLVNPEGTGAGWRTVDDSDSGYKVFVGYHFSPHWFAELTYADLGNAGLANTNPSITGSESISYAIPSLQAGYFFFKPESRYNLFAKAGFSVIQNQASASRVPFEKVNKFTISGAVGAQWRSLNSGLFARVVADFYDKDAASVGLVVGYYLGSSARKIVEKETVQEAPTVIGDEDGDGVLDNKDACLATAPGVKVDINGCPLVKLGLNVVYFAIDSYVLSLRARSKLDKVVATLKNNPDINIKVEGHTDSINTYEFNQILSDNRAKSVSQYLVSHGITGKRLTLVGEGERAPVATNMYKAGRAKNRRVELTTLE